MATLPIRRGPDSPVTRARARLRRGLAKIRRRLRRESDRVVSLRGEGSRRGSVLFSYILDPFLLPPEGPMPHGHTHHWESWRMAHTFAEAGYDVDVVSWTNRRFQPKRSYDVIVDVRFNLERWAPLQPKALKVFHVDCAHYTVNNREQNARLLALEGRRGVRIRPVKQVPVHHGIEAADCATVLGNEWTQDSYSFAGKPMVRIPISTTRQWDWPDPKDWRTARRHFLWFGSGGLVHKGLDLVLEAFAELPELQLWVAGPVGEERDFERLYDRELYHTPNIHTLGFVDLDSKTFAHLRRQCAALVYPTCSEGGGGSVVTCLHAGLVPMVPDAASVDLSPEWGVRLDDLSVDGLRRSVRALSARPRDEIERMGKAAWTFARQAHTREAFATAYRGFVDAVSAGERSFTPRP